MNKKIKILSISIVILLLTTSIVFISKNKSANATLDTVSLKEVEKDNMFAIMINDGSGEYTKSDAFPNEEGYQINETLSGCMDNNGVKIENILTYDSDSKKVTVSTNRTSYCYLYFDKSNAKELIQKLKNTKGLSTNLVGGMYRYIGTNSTVTNNYICLKTVGLAGCTTSGNDENMYRIIGITPEGNIKVIKQIRYQKGNINTFAWNTKFESSDCSDNNCDWPNSDVFKELNTNDSSFLSTLDSKIQGKIKPQNWYYGDIGYEYTDSQTSETIYKIESGEKVTNQKWQKMNEESSIGLMYLSDYLYAISETGHEKNCRSGDYETKCKGSWIHETNNESLSSTTYNEWTMSKVGRYDNLSGNSYAWALFNQGFFGNYTLNCTYAVRPVFYLKFDIELGGAGSRSNPFYIAN